MGQSSKRAALYLRQSLDRAEGIEAQRKRTTALAEAKGWPIVATFEDNEVRASGTRGEGTAWNDMLRGVGKDFEVIVAVDLDRLVRSTPDLNKLIELGAEVVTTSGEIDLTSDEGEFRATMIASIARFETRRASTRQKRHKAAKAERGEWHGGIPPFGYRAEGGTLVPEPGEVKLIKEAARRLLTLREPMHAIVNDWNTPVGLNPDGSTKIKHPTRPSGVDQHGNRKPNIKDRSFHPYGAHWRQSNLRSIMLNRSMLGETKADVQGWKPIIDTETFDRVTELLSDPSRKVTHSPGVKGGKYSMGGGLTVCAKCGKPLIANIKVSTTGKRAVLSCLARVHGPSPFHPRVEREVTRNGEKAKVMQDTGRVTVAHDLLESYVFEQAITRLNDTEYWKRRKAERDPQAEEKIGALNEERERLAARRSRVIEMYEDGDLSRSERRSRLENIEARAEQITKDIQKLVGQPDLDDLLSKQDRKLSNWRKWTPGQRRAFLSLLIERVVVDEWPAGFVRNRPAFKNESASDYAAAREALQREALAARVEVEWRE
ncbi:recombinase family protein [Leifsonia xyli]|uniref:recombinase family protein n=1 Tax=Leifsonia xyli TaxID=1575 RepID=UPI003D675A00